jgi:hypothetical protein
VNYSGEISIDGSPLPADLAVFRWGENNYGVMVVATWEATQGTHMVEGSLGPNSSQVACTFTPD